MARKTSQKGIDLIKSFEGFTSVAFRLQVGSDSNGNPIYDSDNCTYGYGHCGAEVKEGQTITKAEAEELLKQDLQYFENCVNNSKYCPVTDKLNQNQFDALVSFTYNCGAGGLKYLCLNKTVKEIGYALPKTYVTSNGVYLDGLYNRRLKEQALFFSDSTDTQSDNTENSGNEVSKIQSWLNSNYDSDIVVDGIYGSQTMKAIIKALQIELNRQFNAGLAVDGIFGNATRSAVRNIKIGCKGNITQILQAMLICNGYYSNGFDGIFGAGTENAVKQYQRDNGLTVDGIAGKATFSCLCA